MQEAFHSKKQQLRSRIHEIEKESKYIAQKAFSALKGNHDKEEALSEIYKKSLEIANKSVNISIDLINIL